MSSVWSLITGHSKWWADFTFSRNTVSRAGEPGQGQWGVALGEWASESPLGPLRCWGHSAPVDTGQWTFVCHPLCYASQTMPPVVTSSHVMLPPLMSLCVVLCHSIPSPWQRSVWCHRLWYHPIVMSLPWHIMCGAALCDFILYGMTPRASATGCHFCGVQIVLGVTAGSLRTPTLCLPHLVALVGNLVTMQRLTEYPFYNIKKN